MLLLSAIMKLPTKILFEEIANTGISEYHQCNIHPSLNNSEFTKTAYIGLTDLTKAFDKARLTVG